MSTSPEDSDDRLLAQLAAAPPIAPDLGGAALGPGTLVAGRYRVEGKLGQGGMGVVYRAHDVELDRAVALKLHTREADPRVVGRMIREARTMAKLSHPNVLAIYEIGRHRTPPSTFRGERSRLFIVMEYVDGGTLRGWLGRRERDWREVTRVFVQAGRGLAAAHQAGVIHRDFKPDNMLIDGSGRVRVADFGLAHAEPSEGSRRTDELEREGESTSLDDEGTLTATGSLLGTRAYMAPEQLQGRGAGALADQYAFCVSLYEGLHGRRPVVATGAPERSSAAAKTRRARPPRRLERALERGLALDPAERFASMDALVAELEAIVARRVWPLLGGVAVASVAAAATWTTLRADEPPCDARAELRGVWDDDRREALAAAFDAAARPYAEVSRRRVVERLDAYARAWVEQRELVCRGDPRRSDLSARKLACLRRRTLRLDALVSRLLEGGAEALEGAVDAALGLRTPAQCDRSEILAAEPRGAADSKARARDEDVERRLAQLEALVATGAYPRSVPRIAALRTELGADARADHRRRLESLDREVSLLAGDMDQALAAAEASLRATLAGGARVHLPDALVEVAQVFARRGEGEAAERTLSMAESAADALEPDARIQAQLAATRGLVRVLAGQDDEALAAFDTAISLAERALGTQHPEFVALLFERTVPLATQGHNEQLLETVDRGLALIEQLYGPRHPMAAHYHEARARALIALRRHEPGVAAIEQALELYRSRLGPHTPMTLRGMDNLAGAYLSLAMDGGADPTDRAMRLLLDVRQELEQRGREDTAAMGSILIKLGHLQRWRGAREPALESLERGLALIESHPLDDLSQLLSALSGLAEVYAEAGREEEALALLERACQRAEQERPRHTDTALLHMQRTIRLIAAGRFESAREVGERAWSLVERSFGPRHSIAARMLVHLGRIDLGRGDPEGALARFERALALATEEAMVQPSAPGLRYLIARAHRDAGQRRSMRRAARAALEIWPANDDASFGTRRELLTWAGSTSSGR